MNPTDLRGALNFSLASDDLSGYTERCRSILSQKDVEYHRELSWALDDFLFGDSQTRSGALEEVIDLWHAIPMVCTKQLKVSAQLGGHGLIVLVDDPEAGVPLTEIYEPLLKCAHRLLSARTGQGGFNDPLFVAVLNEYMKRV